MLKTVQKERIRLILGYNRNLRVRFHASLQFPCITWVIQLILLAHPCPRTPCLNDETWGRCWEEKYAAVLRLGASEGSCRIQVLSRLRIHPGIHPPGNIRPVADKPAAKCISLLGSCCTANCWGWEGVGRAGMLVLLSSPS